MLQEVVFEDVPEEFRAATAQLKPGRTCEVPKYHASELCPMAVFDGHDLTHYPYDAMCPCCQEANQQLAPFKRGSSSGVKDLEADETAFYTMDWSGALPVASNGDRFILIFSRRNRDSEDVGHYAYTCVMKKGSVTKGIHEMRKEFGDTGKFVLKSDGEPVLKKSRG